MKAVLTNRIYLTLTPQLKEELRSALTYKLPPVTPGGVAQQLFDVLFIKNVASIPIARADLIPKGYEIVDNRTKVPVVIPSPLYELRDSQKEAVNTITDSWIINAKPGYGKTVTALALASKFQQKTLVVTHTVALRDQWVKEVEKILGITASVIGTGVKDLSSPIVIGNVQSIVKHAQELSDKFGLIILDEMHHLPATTFSTIIDKSKARYKIGLSGTLKRKDGKHIFMTDYISQSVYVPPVENTLTPKVAIVQTPIPLSSNVLIPWADRITSLIRNPNYGIIVSSIVEDLEKKGHKVLVVSDRVEFLNELASKSERRIAVTGAYKNRDTLENDLCNTYDTICGSISIFKEGLSINALSALVLATPINNDAMLEQLIGRIQRHYPNKLNPVVIDIALVGNTPKRQLMARMKLYKSMGLEVLL